MASRSSSHAHTIELAAACFAAGIATGWWLHAGPPIPVAKHPAIGAAPSSIATVGEGSPVERSALDDAVTEPTPVSTAVTRDTSRLDKTGAIDELRRRNLRLPLDGVTIGSLKGDFEERRGGNNGRQHEAADMMAARDTPVRAVDHGTVAKLYVSKAGGRTIYQFDQTGRFSYYYAHLERYATGLDEGQRILRGEVIGYVGTSGNAPPNAPHLHFAIFLLGPEQKWWRGTPVNPYLVFKN